MTLEVGGVGYELSLGDALTATGTALHLDDWEQVNVGAPAPALAVKSTPSTIIKVYVHYHQTEKKTTLYAFKNRLRRAIFRLLLQASGVGPSGAIKMLLAHEGTSILEHLVAKNTARLARSKGISESKANKLVLELGKKAQALLGTYGSASALTTATQEVAQENTPVELELRSALKQLGYKDAEIEYVLEKLHSKPASAWSANIETALRMALSVLATTR